MARPGPTELPFIDMLHVDIDAPRERVWAAMARRAARIVDTPKSRALARVLGAEPRRADGRFPLLGGTIPGFRVDAAPEPEELLLSGMHRFATYTLRFRFRTMEGRTRLEAETRAEFPGLRGRAYKTLVIGTGLHVLVTRRLIDRIKHAAERDEARGLNHTPTGRHPAG